MPSRKALVAGAVIVLAAAVVLAAKGRTDRSTPLVVVGIALLVLSRVRRKSP